MGKWVLFMLIETEILCPSSFPHRNKNMLHAKMYNFSKMKGFWLPSLRNYSALHDFKTLHFFMCVIEFISKNMRKSFLLIVIKVINYTQLTKLIYFFSVVTTSSFFLSHSFISLCHYQSY